jgi:transcriptional regulator NrdR family protein
MMSKQGKMKKSKKDGKVCKYCIVKRKRHTEEFDERKVYASCYAAFLNAQVEHTKAEKMCEKVSKEIKAWARKRKYADSSDIFKKVIAEMKKHDKNAAFMYETHRDIS